MNNWQKAINKINTERYCIPAGWDTKEQVAKNLECDPSRVNDLLKPGLDSGDIERKEFPVWDEKRRMAVRVQCYRLAGEKREPVEKPERKPVDQTKAIVEINRIIRNNPGRSDESIRKSVRGSTIAMIQDIRKHYL